MNVVDRTVSAGDLIELSENLEVVDLNGGHLRAVTSGERQEYVILQEQVEPGQVEVPGGSHILGFRDGAAMASDSLLVAVPRGEY